MKKTVLILLLASFFLPIKANETQEVKPVKNVIVMIPDGTSISTVSAARWLQRYMNPEKKFLNIDPYMCGTVITHCSNAPIGDSAPTTSCYMTGYPSLAGWVSTYPVADPEDDIYPNDPERAYQPLTTVLEAARILKGKAAGLVCTSEFPHATPADCSAHSYNRSKYDWIAPQMVHNGLNVVLGGGAPILSEENEAILKSKGYGVFRNDLQGMRNFDGDKIWALYDKREMDYDIDRNPDEQPSLEEMTRLALDKLAKHPEGFFLMVEGSKVDWAAHANDPIGTITEFLAFDRACGAVLDFARENGETAVVILPDHATGGLSIGHKKLKNYTNMGARELFHSLSLCKRTAYEMAQLVNNNPASELQNLFRTYWGFELTKEELDALYNCKDYEKSPIPKEQRKSGVGASLYSSSLTSFMANLITERTCFGFTTGGHTGEEVFLAVYHPQKNIPTGVKTNVEINEYLCNLFGFTHDTLEELTEENFAPHTEVFEDFQYEIIPAADEKSFPTLVVKNKKSKNKQLIISPFTNIVKMGKKGNEEIKLSSVIVYVDKNNTFYLPEELEDYIENK
ncbi:MAG: alkaline phosphatase [Parabacteroides sp.]|nr:alkaline phosphatase [Parabacteroides sp.]